MTVNIIISVHFRMMHFTTNFIKISVFQIKIDFQFRFYLSLDDYLLDNTNTKKSKKSSDFDGKKESPLFLNLHNKLYIQASIPTE